MQIKELCNIKTGHSFRKKLINDPAGKIRVIQPKNILEGGLIDFNGEKPIKTDVSNLKPMKNGDIMVVNRGRFAASVFSFTGSGDWIVPSSIIVLTVKDEKVLPEYIALYLNSPNGQKLFMRHYEETTVPYISRENLGSMNIPVPPLQKQKELIALNSSFSEYEQLSSRKQELHRQLLKHTLKQTEKSPE